MKPNGYKIISEILNESATSRWIDRVSKMPDREKAIKLLKRFMYDHARINRGPRASFAATALDKRDSVVGALRTFHNPSATLDEVVSATKSLSRSHSKMKPVVGFSNPKYVDSIRDKYMFDRPKKGSKFRMPSYAERTNKNPNELIDITHGGGKHHIEDFLKGKNKGYGLENGGVTGIQVSPQDSGNIKSTRAPYYAVRAAGQNFDTPAILRAQIKRKFLTGAPNDYEAGLPANVRRHLKNVKVEPIPMNPDELISN